MDLTVRAMEKRSQGQGQSQQQQQQETLRCPRCDSANTKFCYYNNYSLSQPRHFCKACKRYWTRGGTLRNVPVGVGCKKNKRVKRPPASANDTESSLSSVSSAATTRNPSTQPQIELCTASNEINCPSFFGLHTNPSELSLPYPSFSSRVSNIDTVTGYDLHQPHQLNALGLGFSAGFMASFVQTDDCTNMPNSIKQIQEFSIPSSSPSPFISVPGSSNFTNSPTMASLLASGLVQQQQIMSNGMKDIRLANTLQGKTSSYGQEIQMPVPSEGSLKMGGGQNRLDMNVPNIQNQINQMGLSDLSLLCNTSNASAWIDPANPASVSSLI